SSAPLGGRTPTGRRPGRPGSIRPPRRGGGGRVRATRGGGLWPPAAGGGRVRGGAPGFTIAPRPAGCPAPAGRCGRPTRRFYQCQRARGRNVGGLQEPGDRRQEPLNRRGGRIRADSCLL